MASTNQLRELHVLKDGLLNGTGGPLAKGTAVKLKAASTDEMEAATSKNDPVYGVLAADCADGEYGDVVVLGRCIAIAAEALAVGARVTCTAGGKFTPAAANESCVGIVRSLGADVDGDEFELMLTGPGAGAHGA